MPSIHLMEWTRDSAEFVQDHLRHSGLCFRIAIFEEIVIS
jgi:hypothetical protein